MDEKVLDRLAKLESLDTVAQEENLIIEDGWTCGASNESLRVHYETSGYGYNRIGLSSAYSHLPQVTLTEGEFLSVLVYLIRRGLLENVGLVPNKGMPAAINGKLSE